MSEFVVKVPAHIEGYMEILGEDLTMKFLLRFGGSVTYLPATTSRQDSAITEAIGTELAVKLGQRVGPGLVNIPLAKEWIARNMFYNKGLKINQICTKLHMSQPTIRKYIKGTPKVDSKRLVQQLLLFDQNM